MLARIFRPSKTAMQSGKGKTREWVLEFEPTDALRSDPLMGWTVTSDTSSSQVRLEFDTKEDAVRYAEQRGIAFELIDPKPAKRILKAYADNFAFGRKVPWTH
jgi:ETC complex I subunit conserved region